MHWTSLFARHLILIQLITRNISFYSIIIRFSNKFLLITVDHGDNLLFFSKQPLLKMSIQHDGRLLNNNRDPPGQHSVYILPGDHRTEVYRLITFDKFPPASPVNPVLLARNGFYYLGYKDRVKCFDCANII